MSQALIHDDPSRTTPVGVARYARDYLEASRAVAAAKTGTVPGPFVPSMPAIFLVGQAIELALKAFMLSKGVGLRELRGKKYGHDITACLKKAKELGLSQLLKLDPDELHALELLNALYESKQLQYIVTGAKKFPGFDVLDAVASRLVESVASEVGLPAPRRAQP